MFFSTPDGNGIALIQSGEDDYRDGEQDSNGNDIEQVAHGTRGIDDSIVKSAHSVEGKLVICKLIRL